MRWSCTDTRARICARTLARTLARTHARMHARTGICRWGGACLCVCASMWVCDCVRVRALAWRACACVRSHACTCMCIRVSPARDTRPCAPSVCSARAQTRQSHDGRTLCCRCTDRPRSGTCARVQCVGGCAWRRAGVRRAKMRRRCAAGRAGPAEIPRVTAALGRRPTVSCCGLLIET